MNRHGVALAMVVVSTGPAMAQSPIALASHIETGWTSNATDSAAGEADFYASHSQEFSLTGATDTVLLRGSLTISQTRFLNTTFENDDAAGGAIEAELALGENALLRLGYGITRSWEGDDLSVGGLVVPIRGDETDHAYVAELVVAGEGQQLTVGVDADWVMPGDTTLVGFGLPPLRLAPEVGSVVARVDWEKALSPTLAALAGMEAWFTSISADDQIAYLRAPADGGRVSVGLRTDDGVVMIEGKGGLDMVWPKGWAELMETSPYFAVAAEFAPVPDLAFSFAGETGIELVDPLDGVAGHTASLETRVAWMAAADWTLYASLAAWQETGIFDASLVRSTRTATLGASYAVSETFKYGTTLSWSRHDDPSESYDKTGFALSITGAL